jgi:hypothetical protein
MKLISEPPELSPEVLAVKAELLRRGVVVLDDETDRKGNRRLAVASYVEDWAHEAVAQLLGDRYEVDWIAKTPRELQPARCTGYRDRGMGCLRIYIAVREDEHVDEVLLAEDANQIVVAAYACTPAYGGTVGWYTDQSNQHIELPLGNRPVIDRFTGEVIQEVD